MKCLMYFFTHEAETHPLENDFIIMISGYLEMKHETNPNDRDTKVKRY